MKCPFCDELEDKVVDSRMAKEGEVIRRRRECLSCKRRYTTYERVEETMPAVVKKDGRRELVRPQKIVVGLKKACEKRPISTATIEAVTIASRNESRKWGRRKSKAGWSEKKL